MFRLHHSWLFEQNDWEGQGERGRRRRIFWTVLKKSLQQSEKSIFETTKWYLFGTPHRMSFFRFAFADPRPGIAMENSLEKLLL
jgi:hypothetical protein